MNDTETTTSESRALIVLAAPSRPAALVRRNAAFLAHLIATRAHVPQTRARRRVEPTEAIAVYRRVAGLA